MKKLSDFELPTLPETTHASMRREDKIKRFFSNKILMAIFAAAVVLIAVVSTATLIDERLNGDAATSAPTSTETAVALAANSSAPQELKASFLLAVCSEEKRTIDLLACLTANSEKGFFEISYLSADQRCVVGSTEGSIEEHFKRSGADGLIWAVRACSGSAIDRYVLVDNKNIANIFGVFGEQTLNIPQEVHHEYNGISFIINDGEQHLTADNVTRYFSFLCANADTDSSGITGLVSHYLSLALDGETAALNEKYSKLINLIKTDISAMDIAAYGSVLAGFAD